MKVRMMDQSDADRAFQQEMLIEAAYWRDTATRPPLDEALAKPELAKLVADWGRPGDAGCIAEDASGSRAGAAWYRFWTDDDHSYGYVAEEIPELAIGVVSRRRGQGIGQALLRKLLTHAAGAGVARVSLSVERDNRARQLYSRMGFERVGDVGNAWTMVVETSKFG